MNKVATAVQLRLDVFALRLPPAVYTRLKALAGTRWTSEGEIIVTARRFRTQEANRADARERLADMVAKAWIAPVRRIATKPGKGQKAKRREAKAARSDIKRGRGRISLD